jgi:hypothetical protein
MTLAAITLPLQTIADMYTLLADDPLVESTPQKIKFSNDPVVLACAAYRTWQEFPDQRWCNLDTVVVQQQDQVQANELRNYYRDRIMMSALTRSNTIAPMSTFRQKLYGILNNTFEITQQEIGLLHRLPYFYAEDTALDGMVAATTGATDWTKGITVKAEFTLIARILRSVSTGDMIHYWFTCEQDSSPYCLSVQGSNPLLGFVDKRFQEPQKFQANRSYQQHRGHHRARGYYQLTNVVPLG